ncbi:MAG: molybdopterin molybdotransferase MoeA [Rhodospirillales bacterium]|nr:molybdopterin molybdotransferase MoeA [Rhodospirillales bacterium]
MPLEKALEILTARTEPVTEVEEVFLKDSLDRVLAEDVLSTRDVPPHDNAAVDGYAVHFDDIAADNETRLPVTGRIAAGHPLGRPADRGEAIRIFTGAPMPEGLDTVLMQEDCRVEGEHVLFGPMGIKRGANRRKRAEDIAIGKTILEPGRRLRPQDLGLAASVGRDRLLVHKPLRVAVFSTGDEIRDPGQDAPDGCIFDSNRYTVGALARCLGCEVTDIGILPDRFGAIRDGLGAAAQEHDALITSGGVSIGDEDHVKAAVEALGNLHFWRLAIKPGRPIALGRIGEAAFVGLPGNPVAAMVTFMRIARPVLLRLSGRTDLEPPVYKVRSAFAMKKKVGRREWLRAHLMRDAGGDLRAVKYAADGSGILMSMAAADGLIELPEQLQNVKEGDWIDFLPFTEVFK